jgi:hypothetical protein
LGLFVVWKVVRGLSGTNVCGDVGVASLLSSSNPVVTVTDKVPRMVGVQLNLAYIKVLAFDLRV